MKVKPEKSWCPERPRVENQVYNNQVTSVPQLRHDNSSLYGDSESIPSDMQGEPLRYVQRCPLEDSLEMKMKNETMLLFLIHLLTTHRTQSDN